MEREIRFRGLTVDKRQWIYGSLIRKENIDLIGGYVITAGTMQDPGGDTIWYEEPVIRSSVGQFTGLEVNEPIYEGDLITNSRNGGKPHPVIFKNGSFCGSYGLDYPLFSESFDKFCEIQVIGNIYQNPELLLPQ